MILPDLGDALAGLEFGPELIRGDAKDRGQLHGAAVAHATGAARPTLAALPEARPALAVLSLAVLGAHALTGLDRLNPLVGLVLGDLPGGDGLVDCIDAGLLHRRIELIDRDPEPAGERVLVRLLRLLVLLHHLAALALALLAGPRTRGARWLLHQVLDAGAGWRGPRGG